MVVSIMMSGSLRMHCPCARACRPHGATDRKTYLGMLVHGFRYSIRVLSLAYEHADVHVAGVYEVLLPRVFHDTALGDAPNCCRNSRLKWYCEAKPQRSATRLTRPRSGAPVERSRNARSSRQRVTK